MSEACPVSHVLKSGPILIYTIIIVGALILIIIWLLKKVFKLF